MSIQFNCQRCNKRIEAPDSLIGKRAKCPLCDHAVEVPFVEPVGYSRGEPLGLPEGMPPFIPLSNIGGTTGGTRSDDATKYKTWRNRCFLGASILVVIALGFTPPQRLLGAVFSWTVFFAAVFGGVTLTRTLWRKNQHLPRILRLMKVATVSWLVGMVCISSICFLLAASDVAFSLGNGWLVTNSYETITEGRLLGRAVFSAMFLGIGMPTLIYVPTMAVLFVLWFIERESQKHADANA